MKATPSRRTVLLNTQRRGLPLKIFTRASHEGHDGLLRILRLKENADDGSRHTSRTLARCAARSAATRSRRSGDGGDRAHPGKSKRRQHHVRHCCGRSEEHTSELQSLMRISYAVFCLKKKKLELLTRYSHTYDNSL